MTNTDYIRKHLLSYAEVENPPVLWPDLSVLKQTQWSNEFEQLMRNRLIMGGGRYGWINDPSKKQFDRISNLIDRANKYKETGNDELLVDIANLSLLEFCEGNHPDKHMNVLDSDQDKHVKEI